MDKQKTEKQIKDVLEQIRPSLQRDGGDVKFVEITDDGIVKVRLQGACSGCPMSTITLKMSIERIIKSKVPEVKSVEAV